MGKNSDRIAIYSRKSKFTGKGESIGNQVELCREYVRNMFGESYAGKCEVFEDEGFSGGNLMRPDFRKMMTQVRKGGFRAIVVYRLDRISRNICDFTGLIEELTRLGVSFVSIREQFDTSTPMGRAMMFIISVFSQLERETIAERIRDNMHELAKTGRWLGGNAPTGFRSEGVSRTTEDGKTRKAFRLVPVPEEVEIPKLIFDLYTETDSLTAVEGELIRRRVRTRQGKDFTRFAIKGILQNPVYAVADRESYGYFRERGAEVCSPGEAFDGNYGIMAYNRTDQEKGKAAVLLPVSEWIIAIGQHPGLIPSRQWIRVQESLERNKSKAYRKPRRNEALLTGLLFCNCGDRMYPKLTQRQTADGKTAFTYVCRMKTRSGGKRCSCRNANGNVLDAALIDQIQSLKEDAAAFLDQLEKGRRFCRGSENGEASRRNVLWEEYARNEKILCGLIDAVGITEDPAVRFRVLKRITELSEENADIEKRIQKMMEMGEETMCDGEMERQGERLSRFRAVVAEMTVEEKRDALRTLIQKVVWDGETAHVMLYDSENGLAGKETTGVSERRWGEDSK